MVSPVFQYCLLKPLALHAGLTPAQLVERLLIDHARTLRLDHLVTAVIRESAHTCERSVGRQEVPSGLLPLPQAPP